MGKTQGVRYASERNLITEVGGRRIWTGSERFEKVLEEVLEEVLEAGG